MHKTVITLVILSFSLFSCNYLDKNKKGESELKVAYVMAPGGSVHEGALEFARLVEKNSNGKIKVKLYPNGQLGNDRELTESMILGSVDMILTGPSVIGWYAPEYGIMEAPFMFKSYDHLIQILKGDIGNDIEKKLKKSGIHFISYWLRGPRYLTTTDKVIHSPPDLEGLKLRVPELPTYIRSWKVFGANPTPLPYSDMFMALKQGVVDGQENPLEVIYTSHLYETQKYIMETKHLLSFYIFAAGDPFYKKFSPENQNIIFNAAREAAIYQNRLMEEYEAEYRKNLMEFGTEFIEVDREAFEELAMEVIPPFFEGKWKSGIFDRIQNNNNY